MRVKLREKEIEAINFRPCDSGYFKGFFTLMEYPEGRKTFDCRFFEKGDQSWFSFPSKQVNKMDSNETEYIPLISYTDKTYLEELKSAVAQSIRGSNGKKSTKGKEDTVQDDSSSLWD